MGSDPIPAEAVRVLVAITAVCTGSASATIIRYWMRRGDGGESRRFIIIMVALSAAAASGAAAFIQAAHLGQAPVGSLSYGAIGFAAGLLAGIFPRAAGIPIVAIPLFTLGVATASLSPWSAWADGFEAARLSVYSATDMATKGVLTVAAPRGRTMEREVELKPGPVSVVVEALDIRGPLSLVFGSKRFRVASLRAGPDALDLHDDAGHLLDMRADGLAARALGFSVSAIEADPLAPLELSTATWRLGSDGFIRLEAPVIY